MGLRFRVLCGVSLGGVLGLTVLLRAEDVGIDERVRAAGRRAGEECIKYLDPIVSLSEEQKAAIVAIEVERYELQAQFKVKHAGRVEAFGQFESQSILIEGGKAVADEAYQKMSKEYHAAVDPLVKAQEKLTERRERVLTFPQKARLRDHELTFKITRFAESVKLTDSQVKSAKAALAELEAGAETANPSYFALRAAVLEAMTAAQRTEYFKRWGRSFVGMWAKELGLSKEQLEKANAACDRIASEPELYKQVAGNRDLNVNVVKELLNDSIFGLLTAEQKEKAVKLAIQPLRRPGE